LTLALFGLAGILQSVLAPYVNFNQVHPNFVFVLVLVWSFIKDLKEVLLWALWGGFILDMLTDAPFGLFTFSLLMTAVLASFWHNKFFGHLVLPILLALPYTVIFNLFVLIQLRLSSYPIPWVNVMTQIVFPEAMINLVVMALVLPLLVWLNKFTQKGDLTI